jgi:hypothetical protein
MENTGDKCSICFDPIQKVATCVNNHEFCRDCVFSWLETGPSVGNADPKCPICRQILPNPDDLTRGPPRAYGYYFVMPAGPNTFYLWETPMSGPIDWVVTIRLAEARGTIGARENDPATPAISYPSHHDPYANPTTSFTILMSMALTTGSSPGALAPGPGTQDERPLYVLGNEWEVRRHPHRRLTYDPQLLDDITELDTMLEMPVRSPKGTSRGWVRTTRREQVVAVTNIAVHLLWGGDNLTGIKEIPTVDGVYMVMRELPTEEFSQALSPEPSTDEPSFTIDGAGSSAGSPPNSAPSSPSSSLNDAMGDPDEDAVGEWDEDAVGGSNTSM